MQNKEKVQAKYEEKEYYYYKFTEISFNITKSLKDEKFKNWLIFEFTFKIKQRRRFTVKNLYFFESFWLFPGTHTVIIYYDKNKLEIDIKSDGEPISFSKYEMKILMKNIFILF